MTKLMNELNELMWVKKQNRRFSLDCSLSEVP